MLSQLIHWIREDDSSLGIPKLAGAPLSQELGRPMILLNVLSEFCGEDKELRKKFEEDFQWSIQAILKHVRPNSYQPIFHDIVTSVVLILIYSMMVSGCVNMSLQRGSLCLALSGDSPHQGMR